MMEIADIALPVIGAALLIMLFFIVVSGKKS